MSLLIKQLFTPNDPSEEPADLGSTPGSFAKNLS